jgi:O-antigen/teichoic acid export membrane protein
MSEFLVQGEPPAGFWRRLRGPAGRIRSLLVYLSFSAAANAVGLVTTLFMVRFVAPQEIGRLAIVLGALMVTNTLISFGADNLIAINKTNLEPQAYAEFRQAYSHFALMSFAIWQVVTVLVWAAFHVDDLVLFVPLMSLTKFFVTMASIEYVIEQRAVAYGLVQFLTALAATMVTAALVFWVAPKAEARIAALLLADLALLAVRYGVRPRVVESWRFHRDVFQRIAVFGVPLMLAVGPAYLLNEGDKVIVAHQMGLASTGIYGAACTVAGVVLTFITAVQNSVIPKVMLALKADLEPASRTALRYAVKFCVLSAAFATVFLLAYTLAATRLLPPRYAAAIPAVYVIVVMMQFRAFYLVIGTVTDYLGLTTQKLTGCILGAVVSLGVVFLLVRPLGLVGAGFGVGAGYAALGGWLMFCLKRREAAIVRASNPC